MDTIALDRLESETRLNIDWHDSRCILCSIDMPVTGSERLSEEHIIPEVIWGTLTSSFLCKKCNSVLGVHEAKLKENPSFRLAFQGLRHRLPELFEDTLKRQGFVGRSEGGPVEGHYRMNESTGAHEFRVKSRKNPDGSLVFPNDDGREALQAMLRKKGATDKEIEEAYQKTEAAPENSRVTVAPGYAIAKWTITSVDPQLDGGLHLVEMIDGVERLCGAGIVLLKIAFEFLALHVGHDIYDSVFDSFRQALLRNQASLCEYQLESGRAPGLEPSYVLVLERHAHAVVQIRFFGELVYRIQFPQVKVGGHLPRVYTHDLLTGKDGFKDVSYSG